MLADTQLIILYYHLLDLIQILYYKIISYVHTIR